MFILYLINLVQCTSKSAVSVRLNNNYNSANDPSLYGDSSLDYSNQGDSLDMATILPGDDFVYGNKNKKPTYQNFANNLKEEPTASTPAGRTKTSHNLGTVTPTNHTMGDLHPVGHIEKQIMKEISEKPINLIGEPTLITNCLHDCNNEGLCQRVFIKIKTSTDPDTYSYEPHFSCACRENFKGDHCQE